MAYANLEVHVRYPNGAHEILKAWEVEVGASNAVIYLDANDGDSSYYVEAGTRTVDLSEGATLTIEADF